VPARPLRFCMVTTFYPPYHFGGDGVFVHRLAQTLAERGHEVDVVHSIDAYRLRHPATPEVPFDDHPRVRRLPLESKRHRVQAFLTHQLGRPGAYEGRLREILDGQSYDVIHYHNVSLMGGPGVLRLGRAAKLYTAHEYWLICPTHVLFAFDREACTERRCLACTLHYRRAPQSWRYSGWLRECLGHVDRLLMPSRFALDQHRTQGVERPLVHLPHFVPDGKEDTARDVVSGERPYFLYVGRLERLKGVQDLLRLFASYREADLIVVGDGSQLPSLREEARGLPHVRLLGPLHPSALTRLYREAIAVLVPSLCYETFGLTAAEAFSYGTPAVVRRIGALAEIMEQSGAGFAFDTLEECREALESLRRDPDLRAALGERGRAMAREAWSTEVHVARYLGLVRSLLAEKGDATEAPVGAAGTEVALGV
jgi:glycosyltransferase involved in cell wall biosynthesis